jgi:AraC family transcriptional regulator
MLTYSLAPNAARRADFDASPFTHARSPQGTMPLWTGRGLENGAHPSNGRTRRFPPAGVGDVNDHALEVFPADVVSRRAIAWNGIRVEIIQFVTHDRVEFRFHAPCHLLLVYEEGVRDKGETAVGDLPVSSLRTLRRKLTFVPAGQEYREWQNPNIRSRIVCFYLDPVRVHSDASPTAAPLRARVFFEDQILWETAVKLAAAIEDGSEAERYAEALAIVVAHDVLRSNQSIDRRAPRARGGLAVWQQRIVTSYIEDHLAEPIPLSTLANLVRLSSFYFCRAFKQSFGTPPHRYHISRRIERAKTLLADSARSVTAIALALGFNETSAFSAAFRQITGTAPTEYRRSRITPLA